MLGHHRDPRVGVEDRQQVGVELGECRIGLQFLLGDLVAGTHPVQRLVARDILQPRIGIVSCIHGFGFLRTHGVRTEADGNGARPLGQQATRLCGDHSWLHSFPMSGGHDCRPGGHETGFTTNPHNGESGENWQPAVAELRRILIPDRESPEEAARAKCRRAGSAAGVISTRGGSGPPDRGCWRAYGNAAVGKQAVATKAAMAERQTSVLRPSLDS